MTIPVVSSHVYIDPLHPRFKERLKDFFTDKRIAGKVKVVSGVRTKAQQQALYDKYLTKGWPLAANPNRVIAPGFHGSWHQQQDDGFGYAVDFRIVKRGTKEAFVTDVAAEYGIRPTVKGEWWHFQPRNSQGWFDRAPSFGDESIVEPDEPATDLNAVVQYIESLGHQVALAPLRKGSRGDTVRFAQARLGDLNFDVGTPDGVFGNKTRLGTIRFQRHNSLVADGVIGGKTWRAMWGMENP